MPVAHSWHPSKRKPLLNLRSFSQCSPPSLIFRRMLSVSRIWRIDVADAKPPKWVRGGTSALRYFSDMANLTGDFCFREVPGKGCAAEDATRPSPFGKLRPN